MPAGRRPIRRPKNAGPKLAAEQIVAARQAAFTLAGASFGDMRHAIETGAKASDAAGRSKSAYGAVCAAGSACHTPYHAEAAR